MKQFLEHPPNAHARLLAGPGTGKSTAVIEYASRLLKNNFKNIKLLTFTRAATKELSNKIPVVSESELQPSTIHSFALSLLLRNEGTAVIPHPLRIMADWEWETLVRPRITRLLDLGHNWRYADTLRREMAAKWESLAEEETKDIDPKTRAQFTGEWQNHRNLFGYVELSEIPYLLYSALRSHSDFDIGNLKLLLVDEYQDLNACDLACLEQLTKRGITLFAVGDDDQSIYSFRKAHPAGIREFSEKYSAPNYPLTIAQRFGKNILSWINYVINFDTGRERSKPDIIPKKGSPDGLVAYLEFKGQTAELKGIVELVHWLNEIKGMPLEEILILGRTNTVTAPIIKQFEAENIPVTDPETIKKCFRTNEMREAMAILRLLTNRKDSLSWWTILDLSVGIGLSKIETVIYEAQKVNRTFGETLLDLFEDQILIRLTDRRFVERISYFLDLLDNIEIPENSHWGEWMLELASKGVIPKIPLPIAEYLTEIDELLEDNISLDSYVSQIQPICKDLSLQKNKDSVRVMTMTGSKGLTVQASIVAGCESNIIPHPKGNRDEECRLLYVAMTRARQYLFLTRALRRTGTTARAGISKVQAPRTGCPFLEHGPVEPLPGEEYIKELWKSSTK